MSYLSLYCIQLYDCKFNLIQKWSSDPTWALVHKDTNEVLLQKRTKGSITLEKPTAPQEAEIREMLNEKH